MGSVKVREQGVCLSGFQAITPGRQNYQHISRPKAECKEFDNAYVKIDTWGEYSYYHMNGFFQQSGINFNDLNISDNYQYHAFYRSYIGWKPICRKIVKDVNSYEKDLNEVTSKIGVAFWVILSTTILLSICCCVSICLVSEKKSDMYPLRTGCVVVAMLLALCFFVLVYVKANQSKNAISGASSDKCANEQINKFLKEKDDHYNSKVYNYIFYGLLACGISAGCFFICCIANCVHSKKRQKERSGRPRPPPG